MTKEQKDGYIRGLLEERRGCVIRGLDSRVEQIDAELRRVGAAAAAPAKRASKRVTQKGGG